MSGLAYYNENDDFCADWLEGLIEKGLIAPGVVDRRSILDVKPSDLAGYTQCHFFAGIGIFSRSLREAGWADDRPIWSGSCPCQPLSSAGKRLGFADERHLWPAFFYLIKECRPPIVIGEQVSSPDALVWLDLVQDDMEGEGYAFGALDTSAAGSGVDFAQSEEGQTTLEWIRGAVLSCPDPFLAAELRDFAAWAGTEISYGPAHIRQRLYWVAHSERGAAERHGYSLERAPGGMQSASRQQRVRVDVGNGGAIVGVADANGGDASAERLQRSREHGCQPQDSGDSERSGTDIELSDSMPARRTEGRSIARDRQASGLCAVDGMADSLRGGARDASGQGLRAQGQADGEDRRVSRERGGTRIDGAACKLADADGGDAGTERQQRGREQRQQSQDCGVVERRNTNNELADSESQHHGSRKSRQGGRTKPTDGSSIGTGVTLGDAYDAGPQGRSQRGDGTDQFSSGKTGLAGSDWIICSDGKARQTQSGIFPLVDDWRGPSRISVLRASGNSLVKAQAVKFIKAMMECV